MHSLTCCKDKKWIYYTTKQNKSWDNLNAFALSSLMPPEKAESKGPIWRLGLNKLPLRAMLISLGLFSSLVVDVAWPGQVTWLRLFTCQSNPWFPVMCFLLTQKIKHLKPRVGRGGGLTRKRKALRARKCLAALIISRLKVSTCFSFQIRLTNAKIQNVLNTQGGIKICGKASSN